MLKEPLPAARVFLFQKASVSTMFLFLLDKKNKNTL